ncbi:endo-alpha-N-acetylgalactosaminidase family protein [Arthrobacter tecti]
MSYALTFPALEGVSMSASLSLEGNTTTFAVDQITDVENFRVGTIDIPGHNLLSIGSDQPGATVTTAVLSNDRTTSGDTHTSVTAATPADAAPQGSAYAVVNTDQLAAAFETNSASDYTSDAGGDDRRVWRQATKSGTHTEIGLWSGQWTYRADGAPFVEELPWAKVVVTPDANGDKTVDWQDGALALRDVVATPLGADQTADRVIQRIPYNFGSMATHPFLRTLDDTKRIALATDNLGQLTILKGYQSEGHDSAHPDYGGNYNKRAGGLDAMNLLIEEGGKVGADFGVHVNATEAYPVANNFSDELVDENRKGWNWLDQSYFIDMRRDMVSNDVLERFQQLRTEAPGLDALYLDVYYEYGWLQNRLGNELNDMGFQVTTEWSDHFDRHSLWSHWANDESYGGQTNKGLNSQLIRFVRNSQKDTWNPHPILGNSELRDFEGWTAEVDWNVFHDNVWQRNLPTKFLQQEQIVDWEANEIRFTGGLRATNEGDNMADRKAYVDDAMVLDGDSYLLPWKTDNGPEKLYHYNTDGGPTTWDLTERWANAKKLGLYELTDQGREYKGEVRVNGGAVTLEAEAGTAYVLERRAISGVVGPKTQWGEGSHLVDPGFNAGNLDAWETTGDAAVEINAKGQYEAILRPGAETSISQKISGLTPGTWAANLQVEVEPAKTRRTTLAVTSGGKTTETFVDRSTAYNYLNADEKLGTYTQTVEVRFEVPEGSDTAMLKIGAAAGDASVRLDNLRVVETKGPRAGGEGVVVSENFEDVTQGWYPFIKGDTGGIAGPRTHIAQRNAPFTQTGWNGKLIDDVIDGEESLKAHEERVGLVYRTVPQSVRFEPGHRYRVSFDHQSSRSGYYSWVTGYDKVVDGKPKAIDTISVPLHEQRTTDRFSTEFVAGTCGDYYVGLRALVGGGNEADLVMDNFVVEDLGEAEATPPCAQFSVDFNGGAIKPDGENEFTTTFVSEEAADIAGVAVGLELPEGWTATAENDSTAATLAPGDSLTTTWQVTAPADADGDYTIGANASYTTTTDPVGKRTKSDEVTVKTPPAPPTSTVFASDHEWMSATNGWGPVELDLSNGEKAPDDGVPLTIRGEVFAKGLGVHAESAVNFYLGGQCATFSAQVGIDDSRTAGSVVFSVLGDGKVLAQTGVLTKASPIKALEVDLTGVDNVTLAVSNAGDGNNSDHANWGDAKFVCGDDPVDPEPDQTPIPQSQIGISNVSSEQSGSGASRVLDGNPNTGWHTSITNMDPYPHSVSLDLGAAYSVNRLDYQVRPGPRTFGDYEV